MKTASQKQLSLLRKLKLKKHREQLGVFLAEGYHTIEQIVINKKLVLDELHIDFEHEQSEQLVSLLESGLDKDSVFGMNKSTINDLSDTEHTSGWLAVIQIPASHSLDDLLALISSAIEQQTVDPITSAANPILLALDEIQDPGNMGTITRLADWYGIKNIICSENTVDCFNPKVVQATMGALFRVNITYTSIEKYIKNSNKIIYGTLLNGKNIYTQNLNTENSILIIGNEGHGISEKIKTLINEPITIPKKGLSESLNASVATGIVLSEFFRTELAK